MRTILVQRALALFVGFSASVVLAGCTGAILPVGKEGPITGSDAGTAQDGSGKSGGCTGTNPGCCNPICDEPNPEATCSNGTWTCPAGDTLGPACPAICEVVDGGSPSGCTGTNPGCCSTDCTPGFQPPKATCSNGTWTCPSGDTVGPACPALCLVDSGPPGLTDAAVGCTGTAPSCCGLNAQGCEAVLGTATCAAACPAGDCSTPWAWTCPSGETVGDTCPTYCVALDAGAPDTGSACPGTAPTCCEVGTDGLCTTPAGLARCSLSTGTWVCGNGSEHPPVICGVGCQWPDAGSACPEPEPSCCEPVPLCETLAVEPTCSGGSWTCPSGATLTQGKCICAPTDAGV